MADITVSANIHEIMQAANYAAVRTLLGITALGTTTPGTNVATALGVNVGSAGAFVVLGGALGTPSSGTLTSCTGLPVASGISGFGTNVATALAVNVGSAGAFVVLGGAGGTPSSLTLTNATGLPIGSLADSAAGADRIVMWDQSASNWVEMTIGSGLSITDTTLSATGGGVNEAGDFTWTGTHDFTGATVTLGTFTATTLNVSSTFLPTANDGAALGSTANSFSDLFLASGGVINFNSGNLTLTHSAGVLTSNGAYVGTTATLGSTTSLLLGTAGSAVGNVGFHNATSGTITLAPTTGALGTVTQTLQAVTGTLYCSGGTDVAVADGGTGLSSGTSGGVLAFTAAGTLASSGALAANAIVIGGGAGVAPSTTTTGTGVLTLLGVAANGSASDGPGYRGIPQNSQSAAYTTVMADNGKHILHPTADNNARTFTIDSNANVAYPIGACITFINQINTVTIAITSDTLVLAGAGTTGSRTLAANGVATATKIASTTWVINGTGLT